VVKLVTVILPRKAENKPCYVLRRNEINMKIIVCTGDSHTWGQGPRGVEAHFCDPPVAGGDLRPVPFGFPCYVNLLRDEINRRTGSSAFETEPKTEITGEYIINKRADLARFFYRFKGHNNIAAETASAAGGVTETENAVYCFGDMLTIKPKRTLHLYRAELYSGGYAVINSGVGSCTTTRFIEQFYESYVKRFDPFIIVAEAHTINDWLNRVTPSDVNANLRHILCGCPKAKAVLLTVSPIGGDTALPWNDIDYREYVTESRCAAKEAGVPIADANILIGTDKFTDMWHVNEEGHRIYFETIIRALEIYIP
jgi:hypothetical protein